MSVRLGEMARQINAFVENPVTNLVKGIILLVIGISDASHTFRDDVTHGHVRVGHGLIIIGLFSILGSVPHLLEGLQAAAESVERRGQNRLTPGTGTQTLNAEPASPADPRVDLARDRTSLAIYRTGLALDRTTLAWIRTSLAMVSFGFGTVAFFRTLVERSPGAESVRLHRDAIRMGTALIALGIVAPACAGLTHWAALRRLRRGAIPVAGPWPLCLTVATLTAVLGLVGLWALFTP